MNRRVAAALATVAIAASSYWWTRPTPHPLSQDHAAFVRIFNPPPARDSAQTRQELAQLLELQQHRSAADVDTARADRKTEVGRFFGALGVPDAIGALPHVRRLAQRAEDDIRPYVRAAKDRFRRSRPYVIEPRIEPCIGDVEDDLSYPSGHATYGYVMAYLLSDLVPERRAQLLRRAAEFGRQRMVCGVHFPSDVEAGRQGAEWLAHELLTDPAYAEDLRAARHELRAALHLPEQPAPASR
jgi:acid phosphatase (class A)